MRIYLVRHGETLENAMGIMQGHMNNSLSDKGLSQARRISERLKNECFDVIYSSDLKRAATTASIISVYHDKGVIFTKELRGRDHGDLTGVCKSEVDLSNVPSNFESDELLSMRVKVFLNKLRSFNQEKVLIVSHGRFIKIMISLLAGNPLMSVKYKNTALSVINIDNGIAVIELENDTGHLE